MLDSQLAIAPHLASEDDEMSRDLFTFESITLKTVEPSDIAEMQNILNRASYYHTTVLQQSPAGLADRFARISPPFFGQR